MRTTIHFLSDHEIAGEEYEAGVFADVDVRLAKELVEDGIAEEKTREAVRNEERERAHAEERKLARKRTEAEKADVKVLGERKTLDPQGGFTSMGHFLKDVARAGGRPGYVSPELEKWSRLSMDKTLHSGPNAVEYDDSQGGYLVPPEYMSRLHNIQLESGIVRPRAWFVPMGTNRININAVVDEDHSTNLFGGITIYRPGEAESKTQTKPTFRQIELTLHKTTGLTAASDEILEDSPQSMEAILTTLFGQAMAWQEDDDFINGTGVNQPLGILNAGCVIPVAIEPLQAAATVVAENIINMWARLHPICHKNAVWFCNSSVLPQLYRMGLAVGTGGSVVFTPQGGLSTSPYASLMGRPLIPTEHCAALGTTGDIVLVDLTQYAIGGKSAGGGAQVATSTHLYFNYDLTAFRFVMRYDGQPLWRVALTPANGDTLSPIVTLAARP